MKTPNKYLCCNRENNANIVENNNQINYNKYVNRRNFIKINYVKNIYNKNNYNKNNNYLCSANAQAKFPNFKCLIMTIIIPQQLHILIMYKQKQLSMVVAEFVDVPRAF